MIIPKKVIDTIAQKDDDDDEEFDDDEFDDDEFDDDDDDDSNSDEGDNEDDKKTDDYDPYKVIKDIKTKLESLNVVYEYMYLEDGFRPRIFYDLFKNLRHKMEKSNGRINGRNDTVNNFAMPHKNRICFVVDRRKGGKSKNELFIYKPTLNGDVPNGNVPEWYFQSSFSQIIPGKQQIDTISAKTPGKGYVFCLSFHVEQRDSIKCYLYTRSQMVRFFPTDISSLLPEYFVEENENQIFVEKEKRTGSKAKTINLKDIQFDNFRKQTKGKRKKKKNKE